METVYWEWNIASGSTQTRSFNKLYYPLLINSCYLTLIVGKRSTTVNINGSFAFTKKKEVSCLWAAESREWGVQQDKNWDSLQLESGAIMFINYRGFFLNIQSILHIYFFSIHFLKTFQYYWYSHISDWEMGNWDYWIHSGGEFQARPSELTTHILSSHTTSGIMKMCLLKVIMEQNKLCFSTASLEMYLC